VIPELGTPEFERFLESVREYQRLAGSKFKGKTAARRARAKTRHGWHYGWYRTRYHHRRY
jgi:hypothetical protein